MATRHTPKRRNAHRNQQNFRISGSRAVGRVHAARSLHIGVFTSVRRVDLAGFFAEEALASRFSGQAVYVGKG